MKKIEILMDAFEKALKNGYEWGGVDLDDYEELTDIEKVALFRALLEEHMYCTFIFDHDFAKALWGIAPIHDLAERTYLNYQYHLQQLVLAEDKFKYLAENS